MHKVLEILSYKIDSFVTRYNYELLPYIYPKMSSLLVCFVALRPKSTAMVMAGRSSKLTSLFPGQA